MLAQTWAQRAVRLTLVQQVATTYINCARSTGSLEIAQRDPEDCGRNRWT